MVSRHGGSPARRARAAALRAKGVPGEAWDPRGVPGSGWVTGAKDPAACARGGNGPTPATRGVAVAYTDAPGSDANWLTAGYASGGLGVPESNDRLFNIGWAVGMPHGGLTVLRELKFEPHTTGLVANPVAELQGLRNASLVSEAHIVVNDGEPHLLTGTEGRRAISADIELQWALLQAKLTFGAVVLAPIILPPPAGSVGGGEGGLSGVSVTMSVAAATVADGSREAQLVVRHGGANPGSSGTHAFTVFPGETLLTMRLLVDRVVVEAFIQGGRIAYTKTFVPAEWQHSAAPAGGQWHRHVHVGPRLVDGLRLGWRQRQAMIGAVPGTVLPPSPHLLFTKPYRWRRQ